jgi:pimeloyl-ACP methyl ester carboxylesterase
LLERPDGAEIHWEARGEGPAVLIAHHVLWSYPGIYAGLIADLARDHRVVIYDPRGCGQSSRRGPYEIETDVGDLLAVAEAVGGAAVAIAVGEGFSRAGRAAAQRADLVSEVIAVGPAAAVFLPRAEVKRADVLAASESVIDMLLQQLRTDPRGALRTIITAINPDLDDDAVRERVEKVSDYLDADAGAHRARAWLGDDMSSEIRVLGSRLWILSGGPDPMFEGALAERVADLFPEAHFIDAADGPISRPDITAAHVRRLAGVSE